MQKSGKEHSAKRQKLFFSLEIGETPIKIIGNKLLRAYETLNKPGYTILTPIDLTFEKDQLANKRKSCQLEARATKKTAIRKCHKKVR